jgi:hypothetical protein
LAALEKLVEDKCVTSNEDCYYNEGNPLLVFVATDDQDEIAQKAISEKFPHFKLVHFEYSR